MALQQNGFCVLHTGIPLGGGNRYAGGTKAVFCRIGKFVLYDKMLRRMHMPHKMHNLCAWVDVA